MKFCNCCALDDPENTNFLQTEICGSVKGKHTALFFSKRKPTRY